MSLFDTTPKYTRTCVHTMSHKGTHARTHTQTHTHTHTAQTRTHPDAVATLLFAQLKEAQMQRQEARDKASREQDTINSMQAQLDKEDADLNEARTHTRTHGHRHNTQNK